MELNQNGPKTETHFIPYSYMPAFFFFKKRRIVVIVIVIVVVAVAQSYF